MTEWLLFHFPLSCIGEGNGNPVQCSCLENPRDGGAWWAAVYGVAQSWTRLKRLSSSSSSQLAPWSKERHKVMKATNAFPKSLKLWRVVQRCLFSPFPDGHQHSGSRMFRGLEMLLCSPECLHFRLFSGRLLRLLERVELRQADLPSHTPPLAPLLSLFLKKSQKSLVLKAIIFLLLSSPLTASLPVRFGMQHTLD